MITLFNKIFYQPLFSLLVYIYHNIALNDFGLAVIILTVLVRVILYPIFHKGAKDQAIMQRLAPKLNEIKKKHKHDKEKLATETMRLYKEHKVNPFSQFILLFLVQFPILIALFKIFSESVKTIPNVNTHFLNLIDLAGPSVFLVLFAAVAQYFQAKLTLPPQIKSQNETKEERLAKQMSLMTLYFMPFLTVIILYRLPSAIALYWLTTTAFSVIQQIIINRTLKKNDYSPSTANKRSN